MVLTGFRDRNQPKAITGTRTRAAQELKHSVSELVKSSYFQSDLRIQYGVWQPWRHMRGATGAEHHGKEQFVLTRGAPGTECRSSAGAEKRIREN